MSRQSRWQDEYEVPTSTTGAPSEEELAAAQLELAEAWGQYHQLVASRRGVEPPSEHDELQFDQNGRRRSAAELRLHQLEEQLRRSVEPGAVAPPPSLRQGLHYRKQPGTVDGILAGFQRLASASRERAAAREATAIPWPGGNDLGPVATPSSLWGTSGVRPSDPWST